MTYVDQSYQYLEDFASSIKIAQDPECELETMDVLKQSYGYSQFATPTQEERGVMGFWSHVFGRNRTSVTHTAPTDAACQL
jgi:hypothetical protein